MGIHTYIHTLIDIIIIGDNYNRWSVIINKDDNVSDNDDNELKDGREVVPIL